MSITAEQKLIVKATAPILKENGKEITAVFYKLLFQAHPELLNMFNQTNQKVGTQPLALANTVYFAAENIDDLSVLMPQVKLIAHKHRALTVQPEHYPIVGKYLLRAVAQCLGDSASTEILEAWAAAYNIIASIFIDVEKRLYDELDQDPRDKGFVPLTIVKKERVANGPIVSLALERMNGGKMYKFRPGQYITVRVRKGNYYHNRHYSLTKPFNGHTYHIAIKQEIEQEPKGVVSNEIIKNNRIGDKLLVSFPAGTFCLASNAHRHLFIAGGIGITALSSMVQHLYRQGKAATATLIHCVPTAGHAAFAFQMRTMLPRNQYHLLVNSRHILPGLIRDVLRPSMHVYLCGSVPFMNRVEELLADCDHPPSQIHSEAFRPALSCVKNAVKNQSTTKPL